jgi:hypothetical protein
MNEKETTQVLRKNLISMLKTSKMTVTFIKTDGTERVMNCTLAEEYIQPYEKKTERVRKESDETISVWDLDNDGWRSFRVDAVTEFEPI